MEQFCAESDCRVKMLFIKRTWSHLTFVFPHPVGCLNHSKPSSLYKSPLTLPLLCQPGRCLPITWNWGLISNTLQAWLVKHMLFSDCVIYNIHLVGFKWSLALTAWRKVKIQEESVVLALGCGLHSDAYIDKKKIRTTKTSSEVFLLKTLTTMWHCINRVEWGAVKAAQAREEKQI